MTEEYQIPEQPPIYEEPAAPQPRRVRLQLPHLKPWMTYTLLGITVVIFLLQTASQYLLGGDLLAYYGMKVNDFILQGQLWRFITPVFLHGSMLHIGFNMYALYVFGPQLESLYGHWKFLWLYLVSNFGGVVLSFLLTDNASLGASTAIFGLLGANAVFVYQNRRLFGNAADRSLRSMVMVAVVNLLIGMSPRIDNWGHVGGLLAGAALAWFGGPVFQVQLVDETPRLENGRKNLSFSLAAGITTMVFAIIAAAVIVIRNG